MKSLKYILVLFVYLTISKNALAHYGSGGSSNTVSGYGCNLGNRVYTNKIGTSNFYGTSYDVYNYSGTNYPINWNNTSECNNINANDIDDKKRACWVNTYVNPTNNNSGVSYGTLVYYTLETCSVNPPVGLPLDDYIWVFVVVIGGIGAYFITRKGLIPS
ncbi:MAG: hypothetical protein V4663_11360 [Bacteroidota bacterium]